MKRSRLWLLLLVVASGWLFWPDQRDRARPAGGGRPADRASAGSPDASPLWPFVGAERLPAATPDPTSVLPRALAVCVRDGTPGSERRGAPIAGALVSISPPISTGADDATARTHSAEDGRCELRLPPGGGELRIEAEGFLPYVRVLPGHPPTTDLVVVLTACGPSVHGRLLDLEGRPVQGAVVVLDERPRRTPFLRRRTETHAPVFTHSDAAGVFELPVPANRGDLSFVACVDVPGLAPLVRSELRSTAPGAVYTLRVPRAFDVDVRVSNPDGSPAAGRIRVLDGRFAYDLFSDPLLSRVPGLCATNAPRVSPGRLSLRLPPGGYQVVHEPLAAGTPRAFFASVSEDGPRELAFLLPE